MLAVPKARFLFPLCWAGALGATVVVAAPRGLAAQVAVDAQDAEGGYGAEARVRAALAATNQEDPTAAGTEIDLRTRRRQMEDVSDVIVEVPGVRTQSSGGVGAFTAVSLRGAEVDHTSVLLGTIPLNTPDSGAFDLSLLPASTVDAIEVYRGGVPLWYDQGAIGGVLRYVPARAHGRFFQGDVQLGSFGRAEARATAAVERVDGQGPAVLAHAALTRADNDYEYYFDPMRLSSADMPEFRRQTNGQVHLGTGLLHAGVDLAGGRVEALVAGQGRSEGVPGSLSHESVHSRRQRVWLLSGVSYARERLARDGSRRNRLQLQLSASHHRNRFSDPYGRLGAGGLPVESDDGWSSAYARVAYGFAALSWLEPTTVASVEYNHYDPENPLAVSIPSRSSHRITGSIGLSTRMSGRLLGVPFELRPSALLRVSDTLVDFPRGGTRIDFSQNRDFVPTFRLAAALAPAETLALSASIYSGKRLPSIFELFGDRVFVLASPRLRPESSVGADVGGVLRGRVGALRGQVELRGFATWIDGLIQARYDSPDTLFHANIGGGRILGAEGGLQGQLGRHMLLSSSLTAITTRDKLGDALPLRPPLQALVRPELQVFPAGLDRLSLFGELEHVSFAYRELHEGRYFPARTFVGLGARAVLLDGRLSLQLRVKNLFDQIQGASGQNLIDVVGRPLPGRQVLLSLSLHEGS